LGNRVHIPTMAPEHPKRPKDFSQAAKMVVDIATGQVEDREPTAKELRASKGGAKGGPARARALTDQQRSEIARTAAEARWKKSD
jgi:hypothetical protein